MGGVFAPGKSPGRWNCFRSTEFDLGLGVCESFVEALAETLSMSFGTGESIFSQPLEAGGSIEVAAAAGTGEMWEVSCFAGADGADSVRAIIGGNGVTISWRRSVAHPVSNPSTPGKSQRRSIAKRCMYLPPPKDACTGCIGFAGGKDK
jgi:hypothetical protein